MNIHDYANLLVSTSIHQAAVFLYARRHACCFSRLNMKRIMIYLRWHPVRVAGAFLASFAQKLLHIHSMLGRVALITGASRGIGRSIAHRLSKDGFHIMLSDHSTQHESLIVVEREIKDKGGKAVVHLADVSVEAEVKTMVAETGKLLGSLDVVSHQPRRAVHFSWFTNSLLPDGCKCRDYSNQTIPRQ